MRSDRNGQIMLEALVALSVILIGILGIFSLMARSLSLNAIAGSQYVASNLASEGIELAKNIVESNRLQGKSWDIIPEGNYQADYSSVKFDNFDGEPLLFDQQTGLYGYSSGDPTTFVRKITLTYTPPGAKDQMKVVSSVSWTARSGADFKTEIEDYFYDWRP